MECRGQVVTSGGDPGTGRPLPKFIRVKYILKYTNRHIRKNCPLIISLASAAAEGTQSRRHHSNVNLGSMLNINLSFHHQPKHKQCILLHADILFPSSILFYTSAASYRSFHYRTLLDSGIIFATQMAPKNVSRGRRHLQ